jgi:hypothetical protein
MAAAAHKDLQLLKTFNDYAANFELRQFHNCTARVKIKFMRNP